MDNFDIELKELIKNTNPNALGNVVKSKKEIYEELVRRTNSFLRDDVSVTERIHIYLNPADNVYCKYDNKRTLKRNKDTKQTQYGFCGNKSKCKCHMEWSLKNHPGMTQSGKESMKTKRIKTWIEKYGVDNPSKSKDIIAKQQLSKKHIKPDHRTIKELGYKKVVERLSNILTPTFSIDEYEGCFRKNVYDWVCNACGNIVIGHVDYGSTPRCNVCNPITKSAGENEISNYIVSLGFDVINNDRTILSNKELDIVIKGTNIAIEYNGCYWHSTKHRKKSYHVDKFIECRDKGIKLIQILDVDWISKQDIIKSRLKSILGCSDRIYARNTTIKEITFNESLTFLEETHIQGSCQSSVRLGLYDNENLLVAVMTFGKSRYTKEEYELLRYASKNTVVGGASKLLRYFIKTYSPKSIITYADRCWSDGNLYKQLGFTNVTKNDRNTGYWYIKDNIKYHRSNFIKSKISNKNNLHLSESEIMDSLGYLKYYDCGNYKYTLQVR